MFKKNKLSKKKKLIYAVDNHFNNNNVSWEAINHFYFNKNKQNINDLLELIKENKDINFLVSSENLENLKYTKKFKNFITEIKKTHKIIIIWSVREQYSYLMSLLTMLINKGAFVKNFDILVNNIKKKGKLSFSPYLFWFDYLEQYKQICKTFSISRKDICLIVYSKNKNVFKDFMNILEVNIRSHKNLFNKKKSKSLFQNSINRKNWLKSFFKKNNSYLNRDIVYSRSFLFRINKKTKLNFSNEDFNLIKNDLVRHFKHKNKNFFKIFDLDKKDIKGFYGN